MAKPFVIRVSIAHNGMTSHRTYRREEMKLSRQAFSEYALGNMLSLILTGFTDSLALGSGIGAVFVNTSDMEISGYSVEVIDETNTEDEIDNRFRERFGY